METGDPIGAVRALQRRQQLAATIALEKWMDLVLGASQRIVLLDEGTLAGSADRETRVRGTSVEVVGFYSTVYAARRHEELDVTPSHAGRQPKFLEEPFKAGIPKLPAILGAAIKGTTRG